MDTPRTCPKCSADLRIVDSKVLPEQTGDIEVPIKVYQVLTFKCLNPGCGHPETYEKRHQLYPADGV